MSTGYRGRREFDGMREAHAQAFQPQETPITESTLDGLFCYFIRFPAFFAEARAYMREQYFFGPEQGFLVLWHSLVRVYERDRQFSDFTVRAAFEEERVREGSPAITYPAEQHMLDVPAGLIFSAFAVPAESLVSQHGSEILRRFLMERSVAEPLRAVVQTGIPGSYSQTLDQFLVQLHRQQQSIAVIGDQSHAQVVPDFGQTTVERAVFHKTGIAFFDKSLGGQRELDCNLILGPTGGGKTTLACQLLADAGRAAVGEALAVGAPSPLSAFFSYEEPLATIQPRVLSAVMSIQRRKLEALDWNAFTTAANVEAYEHRLCAGGQLLGERDRWMLNSKWANDALRIYDMSGMGKNPMVGSGYIEEIVGLLQREADAGRTIRTVIIDWAGDMARRYAEKHSKQIDSTGEVRFLLGGMAQQLQRDVAARFNCTVWVLHLLRNDLGNSAPGRLMHHSEAADCKQIAVHMSVCACLGTFDKATGCARMNWSKVRYRPSRETSPSLIRLDDELARMYDVGDAYAVDESSRKIVLREMLNKIEGRPMTQQPGHPALHYGNRGQVAALADDDLD